VSVVRDASIPAVSSAPRSRVFVLTDITNEPDDEQSLIRFLLYTNHFDVEGLVATTSVWLRNRTDEARIRRILDAYAQVRPNLLRHASGYPEVDALRRVTASGAPLFGMEGVGEKGRSPGADLLVQAADRDDPRPLWVLAWGGPNCLGQALWQVRATRGKEDVDRFVSRLRVYAISDQDDSGPWMRREFPGLFYVVSPSTVDAEEYWRSTWSGISGDRHYRNGPMEAFELVDNPWLRANIIEGHGPLGALYPPVAYIMEGDTPTYLNLIPNGLAAEEDPTRGGWGGRYVLRRSYGETRPIYTDSRDTVRLADGKMHTSNQATIWRWREAYQHDFAARMDWCVRAPKEANHNPLVVLNGQAGTSAVALTAAPGAKVTLLAEGTSDPDGHALSYRWFVYPEAGTYPGAERLSLSADTGAETQLTLPADIRSGQAVHILLNVTDNGMPRLHAYRRAIITAA
jgi:hypothetical protein